METRQEFTGEGERKIKKKGTFDVGSFIMIVTVVIRLLFLLF